MDGCNYGTSFVRFPTRGGGKVFPENIADSESCCCCCNHNRKMQFVDEKIKVVDVDVCVCVQVKLHGKQSITSLVCGCTVSEFLASVFVLKQNKHE